ncbi:MAG: sigma-70 family RNA polymerase sigma factor [Gemmataceae bacterium]
MSSSVSPSFDALLAAARRGDLNARGRLFQNYRPFLLEYATTHMATALHAKAEPADLVQETFSEASHSFLRFIGLTEPQFVAWLKRILQNNIADLGRHFQAGCRNVAQEQRLDTPLQMVLTDGEPSPFRVAARLEEIGSVQLALLRLSKEDREVLLLRGESDITFVEIAHRLDKPTADAARKLFDRALGRLEQIMGRRLA